MPKQMDYRFTARTKAQSPAILWKSLRDGLSTNVTIKSTQEHLPYTVNFVSAEEISFSAPTRNQRKPDTISYSDFIAVVTKLQHMQEFNTSSSKELFKGTRIYKKRSPFFALLFTAGIIERVE